MGRNPKLDKRTEVIAIRFTPDERRALEDYFRGPLATHIRFLALRHIGFNSNPMVNVTDIEPSRPAFMQEPVTAGSDDFLLRELSTTKFKNFKVIAKWTRGDDGNDEYLIYRDGVKVGTYHPGDDPIVYDKWDEGRKYTPKEFLLELKDSDRITSESTQQMEEEARQARHSRQHKD